MTKLRQMVSEFDEFVPTPAQQIRTARLRINMAIYLLKGQLQSLENEAKRYERFLRKYNREDTETRETMRTRRGAIVLRASEIWRQLGEVRHAVDALAGAEEE